MLSSLLWCRLDRAVGRCRHDPGTCGAGSGRRGSARRRTPAGVPAAPRHGGRRAGGVQRGVQPARQRGVRRLAPERLLGARRWRARSCRRTARRASRRGPGGPGRGAAASGYQPVLQRDRLPVGQPDPVEPPCLGRRAPRSSAAATSAGGRSRSTPSSRVDGVRPRRRMSWLNDARCRRLSSRGRATKVPLPWIRWSSPSAIRLVDRLAYRRPRDVVRRHQLALGRDRGVRAPARGRPGRPARRVSCACLGRGPSVMTRCWRSRLNAADPLDAAGPQLVRSGPYQLTSMAARLRLVKQSDPRRTS